MLRLFPPRHQCSVDRLRELQADLLQKVSLEASLTVEDGSYRRASSSPRHSTSAVRRRISSDYQASSGFRDISRPTSSEDDECEASILDAVDIETAVIDIVRKIGELLVAAETFSDSHTTGLRSDSIFEYFCDAATLPLLVDLAREKPSGSARFHNVAWSPSVKAEILNTVATILASVREPSALYFILSQNCINELITTMLPLSQWMDAALTIMLPPFLELLKNLARQLSASPHLAPFLQSQNTFPILSAALSTAIYAYAQSDSFTHATSLNLLVDLLNIEPVQVACDDASQNQLTQHLCQLLVDRYERLVTVVSGPVVSAIRSDALAGQSSDLTDHLDLLNDMFWCPVKGLGVKLCETLLRRLVSVLLRDLVPARKFLVVGGDDVDVVPEAEARAQVVVFFFARLFLGLAYAPFLRMLAVALWHAQSTSLWMECGNRSEPYVIMPALNAIFRSSEPAHGEIIVNPYRQELLKALSGEYGAYRTAPTAVLLESILGQSHHLDLPFLSRLSILPVYKAESPMETEAALIRFLQGEHVLQSGVSTMTLECAASVALQLVYQGLRADLEAGMSKDNLSALLSASRLRAALEQTCDYFSQRTLEYQKIIGVADIFVGLVESSVMECYKRTTLALQGDGSGPNVHAYFVAQHGCASYENSAELLIRRLRGANVQDDVEVARFYTHMALHYRAVCRVLDRLAAQIQNGHKGDHKSALILDLVDKADELADIFCAIRDKPEAGTDIDLRGRMSFAFTTVSNAPTAGAPTPEEKTGPYGSPRRKSFADDIVLRSASRLILVLDPTEVIVVKPGLRKDSTRGTVISCISLMDVIAAAADGEWLHVAVKHDDVGFLIKNGNMALSFESTGTCLIVKQYLDRCRQVLRGELAGKITDFFSKQRSKRS